jgi:hypothetical protein
MWDLSLYWTLSERYLTRRTFRYIGRCLRCIYCREHFIILDTEKFSKCDLFYNGKCLTDIWYVGRFVMLDTV